MASGSRRSGLDRFSTWRRLVPGVTYFYLRSVGARTYSPSIRSRIRCFLSGKGSKKGLLRATTYIYTWVSALCYRWWVSGRGWEARTFKMQIRKRKREGGSERKSNIVRGRANVRGSASAVASVLSVPASVFLFPFGHPAMPPRR